MLRRKKYKLNGNVKVKGVITLTQENTDKSKVSQDRDGYLPMISSNENSFFSRISRLPSSDWLAKKALKVKAVSTS